VNNFEHIERNTTFAWLAAGTAAALLLPLLAMQVTSQVNWTPVDFLVMALLLFGGGSLFIYAARKVSAKRRFVFGLMVAVTMMYVWAELAVGIFFSFGS